MEWYRKLRRRRLGHLNAGHRHRGNAFFSANETKVFIGRGLDADAVDVQTQRAGDVRLHRLKMRSDLRLLRDQRRINVHDASFAKTHLTGCFL